MRILYFGMTGSFSLPPFNLLAQSEHEIVAVIAPAEREQTSPVAQRRPLPAADDPFEIPLIADQADPTLVERAWALGIPVYALRRPGAEEFLDLVRHWQVDVACVACFNRILPLELLTLPTHGFLNLHPSRLPNYRGPDPIFWQLRDGVEPMGVTVHWMNAGVDTGDIAAQAPVVLQDGLAWAEIERRCAEVGAQLLLDVCNRLEQRNVQPVVQAGGSYQPSPRNKDFTIPVTWTARRAFNFIRGTQAWGIPYSIHLNGSNVDVDGEPVRLAAVLAWTDAAIEPGTVLGQDGFILIGMAEGTLVAYTM